MRIAAHVTRLLARNGNFFSQLSTCRRLPSVAAARDSSGPPRAVFETHRPLLCSRRRMALWSAGEEFPPLSAGIPLRNNQTTSATTTVLDTSPHPCRSDFAAPLILSICQWRRPATASDAPMQLKPAYRPLAAIALPAGPFTAALCDRHRPPVPLHPVC